MPSVPRRLRTYVPKPRWPSYVIMKWLSRELRWAPIPSLVLRAGASYLLLCSECLFSVSGEGRIVSPFSRVSCSTTILVTHASFHRLWPILTARRRPRPAGRGNGELGLCYLESFAVKICRMKFRKYPLA